MISEKMALMHGGVFGKHFTANLLPNMVVEKF